MRTCFLITKGVGKLGEGEMLVHHGPDANHIDRRDHVALMLPAAHRDANDAQMPDHDRHCHKLKWSSPASIVAETEKLLLEVMIEGKKQ